MAPAERLVALMREHDMTQRDLCRLWNLSPAYISDLCGGRRRFSALVALRLEATFGEPRAEWWMEQEMDRELRQARIMLPDRCRKFVGPPRRPRRGSEEPC